jgi:hypothetical protein
VTIGGVMHTFLQGDPKETPGWAFVQFPGTKC